MKKIISLLLAFVMIMALCPVVSFAEGDVEISFRVGESVLKINGEDTPVETPYVVGDGVTLVPVRVITEAFGAKVGWIEETETVTLEYPGVNIVLQIGNVVAEVNGRAENLLSAPELAGEGHTMVPLRFISENFGAEVSYDDATEAILVVKKGEQAEKTTVVGAVDSDFIGDSYFGWTMENPKDFTMADRSFEGSYTVFEYDDDNYFYISYDLVDEDYDFEREFSMHKNSLSNTTLVKADKNTEGKYKYAHFQAKTKEEFLNVRYFVTDKYIAEIVGSFSNDDAQKRDEFVRIMDTFSIGFDSAKAYDLSSSKDGKRLFEDKTAGVSFMIPDYFAQVTSESQTRFEFYSFKSADDKSDIAFQILSKSEVGSAKELAQTDYNHNKSLLNEELVEFGEITESEYNGQGAYEYSYSIKSNNEDTLCKDVFFEKDEYVYNISVKADLAESSSHIIDEVLNSFVINGADAEELGIIMRNVPDSEEVFKEKGDGWTIELPASYLEVSEDCYYDNVSGVMVLVSISKTDAKNYAEVKKSINSFIEERDMSDGSVVVEKVTDVSVGSQKYARIILKRDDDEGAVYTRIYSGYIKGKTVTFFVSVPELGYSEKTKTTIEKIISSLVIE